MFHSTDTWILALFPDIYAAGRQGKSFICTETPVDHMQETLPNSCENSEGIVNGLYPQVDTSRSLHWIKLEKELETRVMAWHDYMLWFFGEQLPAGSSGLSQHPLNWNCRHLISLSISRKEQIYVKHHVIPSHPPHTTHHNWNDMKRGAVFLSRPFYVRLLNVGSINKNRVHWKNVWDPGYNNKETGLVLQLPAAV